MYRETCQTHLSKFHSKVWENPQRCQQNPFYYAVWRLFLYFYREFPSKMLSVYIKNYDPQYGRKRNPSGDHSKKNILGSSIITYFTLAYDILGKELIRYTCFRQNDSLIAEWICLELRVYYFWRKPTWYKYSLVYIIALRGTKYKRQQLIISFKR